jgi:FMN phosphatase YigB (HAD superfamily)
MKLSVRSSDIASLLDRAPDGTRWLSLDCFDTLVWRDTATPADVFADLAFEGGAMEPRRRAEGAARQAKKLFSGSIEVAIQDIHERLRPGGDVEASVTAELEAEARHCFGFRPVMELIEEAKARGLGVIIVSDTYLSEHQLRALIAQAAGQQIAAAIDHIFPSSAHGVNKADGLFGPVLETLGAEPGEVLHLGDNYVADQVAPAELGIHTAHLVQFDEQAKARLRLEAASAAIVDPAVRVSRPAFQPHRPAVSLRAEGSADHALGHDVLGPMLLAYARWLHDEQQAITARTGRKTHLLFLLRDGFLPAEVYEAIFPAAGAQRIEISRQTAARAGLIDAKAVHARLLHDGKRNTIEVLARQFQLKQGEIAKLGKLDRSANEPEFVEAMLKPDMVGAITYRSAKFADRLIAHLKRAGVGQGDAVIFADLGYHGSVQDKVAPMLTARMGLEVCGRYLLLREEQPTGYDKQGLFDTRHYDFRTVDALCDAISVVEQLCTIAQGSVVDYKFDGSPVRKVAGIKSHQSATRDRVQQGAVAFARAAAELGLPGDQNAWRSAAVAALARLLFLPTHDEIEVLRCFDHDVNLGTQALVSLVNEEAGLAGLRSRGLPYLMHADRMFVPGEIRGAGLSLNLSMLAWRRFGLEMTTGDMAGAPITVPAILADATGEAMFDAEAHPTHDGYYAMALPVGAGRFSVGLRWGDAFECVQIDSARFFVAESFGMVDDSKSVPAQLVHDGMELLAGDLFRCSGAAALTMIPPPALKRDVDVMLHIVFRPIVRRGDTVEMKQAA